MNGRSFGYPAITPAVQWLIIANVLVFMLEMTGGERLLENFALWPLDLGRSHAFLLQSHYPGFHAWQLITYSFLHGGLLHIGLNMYALWLFGTRMELVWGSSRFVLYYLVCVVGAGFTQLLVTTLSGQLYPTIGASGGVFGVLLAFGLTFPNERLMLIFPPVILKAKWFVILYGAIELWAGITGTEAGIAHFAHLGGMLFGYLLLLQWRRHPPRP